MLYTRPQLVLLLILLVAAGAGLAVGHWRARHPELVERLEQLDREPAVTADGRAAAAPRPSHSGSVGSPPTSSGHERTRANAHERRTRPAKLTAPPEATSAAEKTSPADKPSLEPLDLNEAGADDLLRLPGIGAGLARRIIATRETDGRFASVDDLRRVRGVGRVKLQRLRPLVTVAE